MIYLGIVVCFMFLLINILEWEACKILMVVLSVDYSEGTVSVLLVAAHRLQEKN